MKPRLQNPLPVGLGLLLLATNAPAASLTALGFLTAPDPRSFATGLTPDGRYVIGYANSGSGSEAFRWSQADGLVGLGDLPGGDVRSEARGISADGGTVVGVGFTGGGLAYEPFRWRPGEGLKRLGDGLPTSLQAAGVGGMTPDGLVVVGSAGLRSGKGGAYRWTAAGGYTVLGPLPAGASGAWSAAVSADGRTIAGVLESADLSTEGFRWTPETGLVPLGRQAGGKAVQCEVYGLSGDGRFITGLLAYRETGNLEMFRWSEADGMVPLGHFPKGESRSIGYGISDDGRMIVGEALIQGITPGIPFPVPLPRAAVWREGTGLKPLWDLLVEGGVNPASDGWEFLFVARAVSGDGRFVVGSGRRNGRSEAFVADLALTLKFTHTDDRLQLTWPAGFKLQRTDAISPSNWTDVASATSPFEIVTGDQLGFFRITSAQ